MISGYKFIINPPVQIQLTDLVAVIPASASLMACGPLVMELATPGMGNPIGTRRTAGVNPKRDTSNSIATM